MDSLIKSDVFFFITSIAVVLITLLLAALLVYGISILHTVRGISKQVKHEAELITQDIHDARDYARGTGFSLMGVVAMFKSIIARRFGNKRKK